MHVKCVDKFNTTSCHWIHMEKVSTYPPYQIKIESGSVHLKKSLLKEINSCSK